MERMIVMVLGLCLIVTGLYAQHRNLTVEDIVLRWDTVLAPQKLTQIQWLPGSEKFSYLDKVEGTERLFLEEVEAGKGEIIATLESINTWLAEVDLDTLSNFPQIHWRDDKSFWFWKGDTMLIAEPGKGRLNIHTGFSGENAHRDVAEKSLFTAFTRGNNLFVLLEDGKEIAVTAERDAHIVSGQVVHRREFGIKKGTFWSPGGNYLAFYQKDESMVTDYPYVDFTTRPAQVKPGKYPMAGMNNHLVSVGVYDVRKQQTVWLKPLGPGDQYFTNITWSPDEKYVYIVQINRDQNELRLEKYDRKTGDPLGTVFGERDEKYLDPLTGPMFINDDPDRFLWLSRRDGWNHFYLYDSKGHSVRQITRGRWEVIEFKGIDDDGRYVYFTANQTSPVNRDLHRADLNTGGLENLTGGNGTVEEGTHEVYVSENGNYFIDDFSNLRTPSTIGLYSANGDRLRVLKKSPDPLKDYRLGELKIFPITTPDSITLYCRLIYPPDFNTRQKYPLILYVYGGPHSQKVRNTWLGGTGRWPLVLQCLATRGYVILTVDNRGTNYRGKNFEQATFRRLGTIEIHDQLTALREVVSRGFIDSTRIGVMGWSYGGFMAASLMLRSPNTFKVGIAGAPVIDWRYYETIYTERYMDTPEDNPAGYAESSTLNYADRLKGKLLLIHGTSDDIVMWQHTILFLKAAIQAGVHPDYFIYPGHKHHVKGEERVHLLEGMVRYVEEKL